MNLSHSFPCWLDIRRGCEPPSAAERRGNDTSPRTRRRSASVRNHGREFRRRIPLPAAFSGRVIILDSTEQSDTSQETNDEEDLRVYRLAGSQTEYISIPCY